MVVGLASGYAVRDVRFVAAAFFVFVMILAIIAPAPVMSHSAGIVGQTRSGCSCHNTTETLSVSPSIEGLPGYYEPGKVYDLNLSFEGGPARGPHARAGFDLRASGGQLLVPDGSDTVRLDPSSGELTHTLEGNNATSWSVRWRAPGEDTGTVTITLVTNVVNGDGVQTSSDQWGREEIEVQEGNRGGISDAGAFWAVVAITAVMAIIGVAWYATRGPSVQRR
jgi:hypothetical protein